MQLASLLAELGRVWQRSVNNDASFIRTSDILIQRESH